jgi:hypothetical protein
MHTGENFRFICAEVPLDDMNKEGAVFASLGRHRQRSLYTTIFNSRYAMRADLCRRTAAHGASESNWQAVFLSFISQCDYRIDAASSPGWNDARQSRHGSQNQDHTHDRCAVRGWHAIQQAGHQASPT